MRYFFPKCCFGARLLGAPGLPFLVPANAHGMVSNPLFILGVVAPPSWSLSIPLPSDASLKGTRLNTQSWWVNLSTILPLQTSNALQLTLH